MIPEYLSALEGTVKPEEVAITTSQSYYLKFKRLADIAASLLGLVLLLPLFAVVALAIKLEDPKGTVLYTQNRIGRKGLPFTLYKFRSMRMGTPELSTHEFSNAASYVTRVGRFLRRTSLDELPQLWNVFIGNMSLVGPRPLLIREREVHMLRFLSGLYQVRPGITGLAQVHGRDDMDDRDKVSWDREYVQHLSAIMDLRILIATVCKVISHEGIRDQAAAEALSGRKKLSLASRKVEFGKK